MKKLLFFACLLICTQMVRADENQKVPSKVQKVTLFLTGAQVTRTATVNIAAGASTLVFENISPNIDVQSLQVKAQGEFTILSVKQEMNYLNEQAKLDHVVELRAQQKDLRDKIVLQNALLSVNQEEVIMLEKNQMITGQNSGLDLVKLKAALDFQTARLTEIKKREQATNNEIVRLNLELQKYDRQVADILKGSSTATSNVLVSVTSKAPVQAAFTISYVVNNAGWYPTYDIRAKNVNSPVTIAYKANVSQQCGEEWKNIKLTLSTGNPTISGSKPVILPYYLSANMYYLPAAGTITKVVGKLIDQNDRTPLVGATVKVKGSSIGTQCDASGNFSLQVPPDNPILIFSYLGYETQEIAVTSPVINVALKLSTKSLNEVVVSGYTFNKDYDDEVKVSAGGLAVKRKEMAYSTPIAVNQIENQTNIEFNIDNPYTIPADGKQYSVEIDEVNTNATYQYYVAPKLSTDVFLTARITDWNKYNFLSGEANLFFEGTFIGKSLIDTHVAADTLNLSLGVDKNIVVTRNLQKEVNSKQSFGSNKKETRDWLITVKNRKSQPVNLLVEDQVPVSKNTDIEVETQEISGAQMDKLTGKLAWNLTVNPLAEKQLQLKYQVKYPKNQTVIVQ